MNAPLYNAEILRLTTAIPHDQRLTDPMASVERRSPICGSRVTVDVNLDEAGRVAEVGMLVRACALGQASAALLSAHVIGRSVTELAAARDELTAWLAAGQEPPRLARPRHLHPGAVLYRPPPVDPAGVRGGGAGGRGCRDRSQKLMHAEVSLIRDGAILFGFGLAFVLIFRRLGLGATLGYLVAGAVVGPHVLGLVGDAESKLGIAEIGITLLLFIVGLELNPARLWRMKHEIFGLGLLQVAVCGLAITGIVVLAHFSLEAALALGLPLALSSTAQVLPMLQSSGRLRTPFGERAFSILLFQDLSIVPLITIVAAMSRNPADHTGPPGWILALETVGPSSA